jgi:hypothetical protein
MSPICVQVPGRRHEGGVDYCCVAMADQVDDVDSDSHSISAVVYCRQASVVVQ